MSQENVEVVRAVFEAFQAGLARHDPGAVFDSNSVAADTEWMPVPEFPGPASYRGREEFVEFMRSWTEDFERYSVRLEELIDAGDDRVVVLAYQWAAGKGSGVEIEMRFGQVFELKDGCVIQVRNYLDPAEALNAVGLSE